MNTAKLTQIPAAALPEPDAGHYIGYSRPWMRRARRYGNGPVFVRCGRSIRYRIADLDAFLEQHRVVLLAE